MRIDRRDLKRRARDAMRAASPNVIFMTFIYLLLTAGLGWVVGWFAADPLGDVLNLYEQGVALDRAVGLMLHTAGRFGVFLALLMAIWRIVVNFGYKFWCLRAVRGERGEPGELMAGFSMVGRILWLQILIGMYCMLWYVAITVPVGVLMWLVSWMGLWAWILLLSVPIFLLTVGLWFFCILRYAMAEFCLIDEPELGASWALRRSCQMMRGKGKDYILLWVSFVGWFLLGWLITMAVNGALVIAMGRVQVLTSLQSSPLLVILPALAGVPLYLWLMPYITMTTCNFYEKIKGGTEHEIA